MSPAFPPSLVKHLVSRDDRDYCIENLALMLDGGLTMVGAMDALIEASPSRLFRQALGGIAQEIQNGTTLWLAIKKSGIFSDEVVALIRIGEEAGRLAENLRVLVTSQRKERVFRSRLKSAMMYPVFVLVMTVVIGIGIAWFILPQLAGVFSQLRLSLPLVTRLLIQIGTFFGLYGRIAVPIFLFIFLLTVFLLFGYRRTSFLGQAILFSLPGIKGLLKEIELARSGFMLGTLLTAGIPITQALRSLGAATIFSRYQKFYAFLGERVSEGNSLQKSFSLYQGCSRLVPQPIQQLVIAGERSGRLAETYLKIGQLFDEKVEITTKNLTIILEPMLLVIVWLAVLAVALAIILPIYSLIGGLSG